MRRNILVATTLCVLFGTMLLQPWTVFAQPTATIEIGIAGGQKIQAKVKGGGPEPAEDSRIKSSSRV
jgi:hypothetical protein